MKYVRKFLSKMIVAIVCITFAAHALAATNIPTGDIGNYGTWATEYNYESLTANLGHDLNAFQSGFQTQLVSDYVPVEARVGIALMSGLNNVAKILDITFVRFMFIFLIVMYAFWIMLEAYNMMSTDSNVPKLVKEIVKRTTILIIWIAILKIGPAKLFMAVVGPIITLGTYIADFILNAIAQTANITIPDTCRAIHEYAVATIPNDMIINANAAADILCIPTRLSGFFTTGIAAGFKWMGAGIGFSMFTFTMGAVFVVIFAWNTWKFALMALSVIVNLFLGVLLLPFTALAESVPQTTYKGIMGNIFNSFIGLFNVKSFKLDAQISRFINAAVYFVSLSIVIAVCAALLSGVIDINILTYVPTLHNDGFIPMLLTASLVAWLANKADKIARDIGGTIPDDGTGKQFTEDIKRIIKDTYDNAKSWAKAIAEEKKK